MNRAIFEELVKSESSGIVICADSVKPIDFYGRIYIPDETKGYIRFRTCHAFPVINAYGQSVHPNVIAISYKSLLHQNANFEHQLAAFDPKKNSRADKILGSVIDVNFPTPKTVSNKWVLNYPKDEAPAIEGVATFAKMAMGMGTVVGRHQTGRHNYQVSYESKYGYGDCGFAIELKGKKPDIGKDFTPDDMVEAGWEFIPWSECDDDLLSCFSRKAFGGNGGVVKEWKRRKVVQMLGGLDKPIHYTGLGVVAYSAEKEAEILQMAASAQPIIDEALSPLLRLADLTKPR